MEDKKTVRRTGESMRDRYRKYLKFLSDENLQEVFDYLE